MVVRAATWCELAYSPASCSFPGVTAYDCAECDAVCICFDVEDKLLVVAVRGTHTFEDALCDLEVLQVPLSSSRGGELEKQHEQGQVQEHPMVHFGFKKQAMALTKLVGHRTLAHLSSGGRILFTGHSLGAGVASIMAGSCGIEFPNQVSFIGYGTPRQGNQAFAKLIADRSIISSAIRVKNHRDPVCASIPSLCFACKYVHAGMEISIGKDPFPDIPDPLCTADHMIDAYIKSLSSTPSLDSDYASHSSNATSQSIKSHPLKPSLHGSHIGAIVCSLLCPASLSLGNECRLS